MKTQSFLRAAVLGFLLSTINYQPSAFGQGSIIPTTAPSVPIMKTLDQVESRTPIPGGTNPYTISAPGSYYLTGNLTVASGNAITITTDNVTLDLNGFTISSTSPSASGNAIDITGGRNNLAIFNGNIRSGSTVSGTTFTAGSGFLGGINWNSGAPPKNVRVSGVTIVGVRDYPLDLGTDGSSVVQACSVRICSQYGIHAGAVSDSSALQCGAESISATTIANCVGSLTSGGGTGITTSGATLTSVQSALTTTSTNVSNVQTTVNQIQSNVNQIETRTPISVAPFTISTSGSYYLTQNLAVTTGSGITISSDDVTLDLNGFTISSTANPASGSGVSLSGTRKNIQIKNGGIKGTTTVAGSTFTTGGFINGILGSSSNSGIIISDIRVQGVAQSGISHAGTTAATMVERCFVSICGLSGIEAQIVRQCVVTNAGDRAIWAVVVSDCSAASVGTSGLDTGIEGTTVTNSRGVANAGAGIVAVNGQNCSGTSTSGTGIGGGTFISCRGSSTSGTGVSPGIAIACTASSGSGTAFTGGIAIGCSAGSSPGFSGTHEYFCGSGGTPYP
jgi:hypothetical protein